MAGARGRARAAPPDSPPLTSTPPPTAAPQYAKKKGKSAEPKGLRLMVDGTVPPGAGVSSSSALVVASLLAVARGNGFDEGMTRADLGEAARACELFIGTMSGGMDQAASAMGEANRALRIDFEPLKVRLTARERAARAGQRRRHSLSPHPHPPHPLSPQATAVPLPQGAVFVIGNTLDESCKAVGAEKGYNLRVVEGKIAAKIVAKKLGVADWAAIKTFRALQEAMKLPTPGALLPAIEKFLEPKAYSAADAEVALELGAGAIADAFGGGDDKREGALRVLRFYGDAAPTYELLKRARHVCSEAERVSQLQAVCGGAGGVAGDAQLKAMGALLTASHASCRDDYECSSTGLDAMVELALGAGAFGSRLTGAGWGGCTVSLVATDKLAGFLDAMAKGYYAPRGRDADVPTALFASTPGSGAAVYTPATDEL